jgi:hypothetical protein
MESKKKLSLNKETVLNLRVNSGVQAGMASGTMCGGCSYTSAASRCVTSKPPKTIAQ